jgi:glycine cleavage system aminomethyltransferase T
MDATLTARLSHPIYGDHVLYHAYNLRPGLPTFRAWQFNGWPKESLSWRTGCYIHAGLSSTGPVSIKGPEAGKYLQSIVINSLEKFPVGSMKHAVMCTEDGLIGAHGIVERKGEEHFESFAGGPPGAYLTAETPFEVELKRLDHYLFQIAGPTSLQVLEKATGESLRDVRFLHFRDTRIDGVKTEVARIGMTGGLAYELHGPVEEGPAIYDAVYRAGQAFGIERLGWGTYLVNHVEGGFPQGTWTFVTAAPPALRQEAVKRFQISGSVDPTNTRARMRTPVEVRWHNMARFDHDFIGREALAVEIANPRRTTVTLRWNADDVMDTYASLLRPGTATSRSTFPMHRRGGQWRTPTMSSWMAARSATPRAPSTARRSASFFPMAASMSKPAGSGMKSSFNGAITAERSRTYAQRSPAFRISPRAATAISMPRPWRPGSRQNAMTLRAMAPVLSSA